jgi:hypothetical protein
MQVIENKTNTGVTVTIDDKHFVNCRFKNCVLVYSGGDYGWTETSFENCQVTLSGPAERTAGFLGRFGIAKPPDRQQPINITKMKSPSGLN